MSFTEIYNDIILISHCKETDLPCSLQTFIQLFYIREYFLSLFDNFDLQYRFTFAKISDLT